MQVLGEHGTRGGNDSDAPAKSWVRPGRRRGARVRARTFVTRPKRARRRAWDLAAPKLPDPLLTAPMAVADPLSPTAPNDEARSDRLPNGEPGDTVPGNQPVHAIDLSDHPTLIVRPEPRLAPPPTLSTPSGTFIPAPIMPPLDATQLVPLLPGAPATPAASATKPGATAPSALDLTADLQPRPSTPAGFSKYSSGRNQLPDPVHFTTEPARRPEAMLAAVLGIVAGLAAWGTAAPAQAWIPLAVLPAVGLIALMLPGGSWARVARAGTLLAAAASLPMIAPALTPVTLVVALATAALYPMLIGAVAGRAVTVLAIGSLAAPLVTAAWTEGLSNFLRPLLTADGDPTAAIRLALSSGILVVALVGWSAVSARRTLTRTTSVAVSRERTARAATARLGTAANRDATTGLPNREALLRALTVMLADSDRLRHPSAGPGAVAAAAKARVGLVLIEIERFAQLADSLGSAIADDLAEQVAQRLRTGHPTPTFLARVSRHQFVLVLPEASSEACAEVARETTALIGAPLGAGDRELSITCSMGAVLCGPGLRTADDLLQAADEASRAAQRTGRSRWVMFDQAVRAHALSQATLELELRDAVRLQTIEVAFQPVLAFGPRDPDLAGTESADDRIVGAEVLARWTRADGTTIEPGRFIPLADELGLGVILGMQVIRQALEALIGWRHEGVDIDQVWVNLAASQLEDPEFAHEVAAQLAIRGLAASCLVLEISAGQLVESEQCLSTLGLLRSLGIAVALDDFGRNGTSLSALRRLPISAVKLDPSLAAELGRQDAVPKAVAQLCRTLGLRVVIEGVETMVQLRGAREIEADAVQGFAIARPMSAEDITNLLTLRLPRDFRLR